MSDFEIRKTADAWEVVTDAAPVTMTKATGFVTVSWWRDADCTGVPPLKGSYSYEHCDTLEEAYDHHREYENGEFSRATAIGIFACVNGMPVGGRIV